MTALCLFCFRLRFDADPGGPLEQGTCGECGHVGVVTEVPDSPAQK